MKVILIELVGIGMQGAGIGGSLRRAKAPSAWTWIRGSSVYGSIKFSDDEVVFACFVVVVTAIEGGEGTAIISGGEEEGQDGKEKQAFERRRVREGTFLEALEEIIDEKVRESGFIG